MFKVKIHRGYRDVIAICDSDLIGKRFEEGKKQIDVKSSFFDGEEKNQKEIEEIMQDGKTEDSTFNIVGKKSVEIAIKTKLIAENGFLTIQGIPVALVLL